MITELFTPARILGGELSKPSADYGHAKDSAASVSCIFPMEQLTNRGGKPDARLAVS